MRCNGGAGKCSSGTCKACGVHNAPCVSDSDCCAGFCTGGGTAQGVCSCYTSGIPVGDESQCCNGSQFINYTIVCN
jgi:hypothetical protein